MTLWRGGWGWLLPLPLWEWAPPWVCSKPCPLRWRVGCPPTPRIVLVPEGGAKHLPGVPPYAERRALGGALVRLVARVGAPWSDMLAWVGARGVGAVCRPIHLLTAA